MGYSGRRTLTAARTLGFAAVAAAAVACDSQSGIPAEVPEQMVTVESADTEEPTVAIPSTTPRPAPQVTIGTVPGNSAAVDAVRAWVTDLITDRAVLPGTCWTLPPAQITEQHEDTEAILTALAQPGVDGQFAVSWTGAGTTVSVKRSEIASGYACPHVHPSGTDDYYTPADAEHAVTRFLSREAGRPVHRADTESTYPLICPGFSPWDPAGTGSGGQPPLKLDPDVLAGTTDFDAEAMTSKPLRGDYIAVTVPVTDVSGVTESETITLTVGSDGYCLGEVT
ncbi:MAG: hypothetical protein WAW17_16960 [Rhodococcus sp. (in: high G+C Gram-positive bacteria)]|uniref:hypothetical protein n=1 Tax=Rhodococcus sp. TaxID=1831 RepID=UPI003BAF0E27